MTKASKAAFLAEHDPKVFNPNKIRAAFAEMIKTKGREAFEYEQQFSRLSGVATNVLPSYRKQFAVHIVETPRRNGNRTKFAWFADPKIAAECRAELAKVEDNE